MHCFSVGVYELSDSYQHEFEPRLVVIGHWDIPRASAEPVFGGPVEDEVIARMIALSQLHQRWVAVDVRGLALHIRDDTHLPRPVPDDVEYHRFDRMTPPQLGRFPLHSPLANSPEPISPLCQAFDRLAAGQYVRIHPSLTIPTISLAAITVQHLWWFQER